MDISEQYLQVIHRQNLVGEAVAKKYDLFCLAQNRLAELYRTDPIISNILKSVENMSQAECSKYLRSSKNDMKSSHRYEESIKLNDELTKAQIDYYETLFSYIKMIDNDRKELFSPYYLKRLDELADAGYLLYYLQTPDLAYEWLINSDWENIIVNSFEIHIDLIFSEMLATGLVSNNKLEMMKTEALRNSIKLFKDKMYDPCARELFNLIENDYSNTDNYVKKNRRKMAEKTEFIRKKVGLLNYEYFINAFGKIASFYKLITVNTDDWDKKEINRNALSHGNYDRITTKNDCVKLFMMYISFKEISYYVQRIDDLFEHLRIISSLFPKK